MRETLHAGIAGERPGPGLATLRWGLLCVASAVVALPLGWMLLASLRPLT